MTKQSKNVLYIFAVYTLAFVASAALGEEGRARSREPRAVQELDVTCSATSETPSCNAKETDKTPKPSPTPKETKN